MRFPAVTVCNMNPLRYSQVQDNYDLMSAVQVAASKWGVSLNAFEHDAFYNVSNEVHIQFSCMLVVPVFVVLAFMFIVNLVVTNLF